MQMIVDGYFKLLKVLIALFLAIMVILVFGNVVLRYGFNSGITVSEEVSRWLFVWLTFLGAIIALREHGHLGVDMLVRRLPNVGKRTCLIVSQLMLKRFELLLLFRLFDHDKLLVRELAGDGPIEISQQNQPGGNPEHNADAVEPAGRQAGRRGGHVPVDQGLLPAALQQQPGGIEHQELADDQAGALAGVGQAPDQHVDAEMAVLAQGDDGAQEGEPDEQPARDLLGDGDARIEAVAQDHVAEDENDHDRQEEGDQDLEQLEVPFHNHVHRRFLCLASLVSLLSGASHRLKVSPHTFWIGLDAGKEAKGADRLENCHAAAAHGAAAQCTSRSQQFRL